MKRPDRQGWLARQKARAAARRRHCTHERRPFTTLAAQFLPADRSAIIVDVGAGDAEFASTAGVAERYPHLYLLDANVDTVTRLQRRYAHVVHYRAPHPLPFDSASVSFVHCSHLVEHLNPTELHELLQQIDRVLTPGGILVISTPLLWEHFFDDLTHVRPYGPRVFMHYLSKAGRNRSEPPISTHYAVEILQYRYRAVPLIQQIGSENAFVELLLRALESIIYRLLLRRFERTGFTLVLRKSPQN